MIHVFMLMSQNMVEARNANYTTVLRTLCFGKRGAANVQPEHAEV